MLKKAKSQVTEYHLLYIIPMLFALASLLITNPPLEYDDLVRFHIYFDRFRDMSIDQFIDYISDLPDYIIPVYIYVCAKIGIPVNILLSIINFITVYILLKTSLLILSDEKRNFFSCLFIASAINSAPLLSGVRNMHSIALLYLGLYFYVNREYFKSGFLYFFSIGVHFSSLLYSILPGLLIINIRKLKILWYCSFIGFLMPVLFLSFTKESFDAYSSISIIRKIQHYLFIKDYYFRLTYKEIKIIIVSIYKFSWYVFVLLFLFYQSKNSNDKWLKILFIISILMNISFLFLTVFERISFLCKIIFVVCLLQENSIKIGLKKRIFVYFIILFLFQAALFIEGIFDFV